MASVFQRRGPWTEALDAFLKPWTGKPIVVGALVCGSFVTGSPSPRSDIDVHLVLSDKARWRERGNRIIRGYLIEYFANPAAQILKYFEQDFKEQSYMAPTMFVTGRILLDRTGAVAKLVKKAESFRAKPFPALSRIDRELKKYALWDNLDNLEDSFTRRAPDFSYQFFALLSALYRTYATFLRYPVSGPSKVYGTLSDARTRENYRLRAYPDATFSKQFCAALTAPSPRAQMAAARRLTRHVLARMHGFSVDGWRLRSPVDK